MVERIEGSGSNNGIKKKVRLEWMPKRIVSVVKDNSVDGQG